MFSTGQRERESELRGHSHREGREIITEMGRAVGLKTWFYLIGTYV